MKRFILMMVMVVMMGMSVQMTAYASSSESEGNVEKFIADLDISGAVGCEGRDELIWMGSSYEDLGYGYYRIHYTIYDIPYNKMVTVEGVYKAYEDELMQNTIHLYYGGKEIDIHDSDVFDNFREEHPELIGLWSCMESFVSPFSFFA